MQETSYIYRWWILANAFPGQWLIDQLVEAYWDVDWFESFARHSNFLAAGAESCDDLTLYRKK